jgi:ATP-dependent Clp protease protease subunit
MSKFLISLVLFFGLAANASTKKTSTKEQVLTLTERNTVVLRNVVDSQSVTAVQLAASKLSQNLAKSEPIYLFLDTPGGSIQSGNEMIATLKGLPQKVHTVTSFAASMGFITVQSLGTRYILPNGILMSHRASGGARGQIPGELNVRVNFFTDMLDSQDEEIAARVGLGKKAYQKLIRDEYWVYGTKAVKVNMADKTILVRCNKALSEGKTVENVATFFGDVQVTYSTCPLITAPLEVSFDGLTLSRYDEGERIQLSQVRKTILTLLYNKRMFYTDYILTNKYQQVFP